MYFASPHRHLHRPFLHSNALFTVIFLSFTELMMMPWMLQTLHPFLFSPFLSVFVVLFLSSFPHIFLYSSWFLTHILWVVTRELHGRKSLISVKKTNPKILTSYNDCLLGLLQTNPSHIRQINKKLADEMSDKRDERCNHDRSALLSNKPWSPQRTKWEEIFFFLFWKRGSSDAVYSLLYPFGSPTLWAKPKSQRQGRPPVWLRQLV